MADIKYIGQRKVKEYNEVEGKVTYLLEDSSGDTVTSEQYEAMTKDKPYDEGDVRIKKWLPAVRDIMVILLKNDMKLIEKDFITGRVDATIIQNYELAAAKLFGANYEHNISLSMIDRALKLTSKNDKKPTT